MASHEDYNTGELSILYDGIDKKLEKILIQTTSTNGRVKSLEMWRMFLLGAWAVITILIPVLYMQVSARIDEKFKSYTSSINRSITDAIEANNERFFEKPYPNP